MSETTAKRARSTAFATGAATGKRITKSKTYTVAEVADLCGVSTHAVTRWLHMGYLISTRTQVDGTKRSVHQITGEALVEFFATRKQHQQDVATRRADREAQAAARAVVDPEQPAS